MTDTQKDFGAVVAVCAVFAIAVGPASAETPNGNAWGHPIGGSVGNADNKNPPGQSINDKNSGYESDGNKGVGKGNPSHTSTF